MQAGRYTDSAGVIRRVIGMADYGGVARAAEDGVAYSASTSVVPVAVGNNFNTAVRLYCNFIWFERAVEEVL